MAALLPEVGPGDEVIVPSFTFVLDRQRVRPARRHAGLRRHPPRHAEPRRARSSRRRSPTRTRRSSPCTTPASAARWTALGALRRAHGLIVVEDAAQGIVRDLRGRAAGRDRATSARFSFHETKNVTAARAGRCSINDAELRRARGDPAGEGHQPQPLLPRRGRQVHVGGHRLVVHARRDHAAFLWAQLERVDADHARRLAIWEPTTRRSPSWSARACCAAPSSRPAPGTTRTCTTAVARRPGDPRRDHRRARGRRDRRGLPLRAAALLAGGPALRPRARPWPSPTTAAGGCCACRCGSG